MSKLSYRPRALADLDFIYDIIAPDSPERAFAYVDDIRARCRETLLAHPLLVFRALHPLLQLVRVGEHLLLLLLQAAQLPAQLLALGLGLGLL